MSLFEGNQLQNHLELDEGKFLSGNSQRFVLPGQTTCQSIASKNDISGQRNQVFNGEREGNRP